MLNDNVGIPFNKKTTPSKPLWTVYSTFCIVSMTFLNFEALLSDITVNMYILHYHHLYSATTTIAIVTVTVTATATTAAAAATVTITITNTTTTTSALIPRAYI